VAASLEDRKVTSLSPGRGTLTNKWAPKLKPSILCKICHRVI